MKQVQVTIKHLGLVLKLNLNKADVTITKKGEGIAWGALYWQYFEDLDKITSAETPLKLSKKLILKIQYR